MLKLPILEVKGARIRTLVFLDRGKRPNSVGGRALDVTLIFLDGGKRPNSVGSRAFDVALVFLNRGKWPHSIGSRIFGLAPDDLQSMGVRAVRSDGAGNCNAEKSHCGQTECEAHFQTGLKK